MSSLKLSKPLFLFFVEIMEHYPYHIYTERLIEQKRWNEIQPYNGLTPLYIIERNERGDPCQWEWESWLKMKLLRVELFTEEMYEVWERIFGEVKTESVMDIILYGGISLSATQYLLQMGKRLPPYLLLQYGLIDRLGEDYIPFLDVLFAYGADANEKNEEMGMPILMEAVRNYVTWFPYLLPSHTDMIWKGIEYLLDRGADPLLEDKEGKSTMEWIRPFLYDQHPHIQQAYELLLRYV